MLERLRERRGGDIDTDVSFLALRADGAFAGMTLPDKALKWNEEKNKYLMGIAYPLTKPYESFEGRLWQLKPNIQFSKETQNTLFGYYVLSSLGDGVVYLYDICD